MLSTIVTLHSPKQHHWRPNLFHPSICVVLGRTHASNRQHWLSIQFLFQIFLEKYKDILYQQMPARAFTFNILHQNKVLVSYLSLLLLFLLLQYRQMRRTMLMNIAKILYSLSYLSTCQGKKKATHQPLFIFKYIFLNRLLFSYFRLQDIFIQVKNITLAISSLFNFVPITHTLWSILKSKLIVYSLLKLFYVPIKDNIDQTVLIINIVFYYIKDKHR